jgi:hypothetical protein
VDHCCASLHRRAQCNARAAERVEDAPPPLESPRDGRGVRIAPRPYRKRSSIA